MPEATVASPWGAGPARSAGAAPCEVRDLGRAGYGEAWDIQRQLVRARKADEVCDQLVLVEHPPTITLGRNADAAHVLADSTRLRRLGVDLHETNRGGDVTYHGPGQLVAYPILDLKQWRRDVGAYLRALEEVMIRTLLGFGIRAGRVSGLTGVWVGDAKIGALGVHLSRWVTSHGLALNVAPDLGHFALIVPCGLTRPVTSMERILGRAPNLEAVTRSLAERFGEVFGRTMTEVASPTKIERGSLRARAAGHG